MRGRYRGIRDPSDELGSQTWGGNRVALWNWFGRRAPGDDPRLRQWKQAWAAAVLTLDHASGHVLRQQLNAFGLPEEEIEIEREMLDALEEAAALAVEVAHSGLPIIETGHRVVGREACHFTAAASLPDEAGQPGGRLLLTSGRAIFAGGPATVSCPWHMVADARHADRDLVLTRTTRDRVYRFRCNLFSDAIRAALVAGELIRRKPA